VLLFYVAAQAQLFVVVGGSNAYPGASAVLARYHGDPTKSRFQRVLDPGRPAEDPKNMWKFLGPAEEDRPAQRKAILDWVEAGTPRERWPEVMPIFTGTATCAACHAPGASRADLPLDTYEHVVAMAGPDRGMTLDDLTTTTHNHLMGFAVAGLLVGMIFTASRWRGPVVSLLAAGVFVGAAIDVLSWWLTHWHGSPWHYAVLLGGGIFGGCLSAMAVLSLDELWFRGAIARLAEPLVKALRLGSRAPATAPAPDGSPSP
jgi:hypothetical protein